MLPIALNLCLTAILLISSVAHAGTLSIIGQSRWVQVAEVFDGDTFRTRSGERIRLLGINTPEVAHHNQPEQAYSKEAKRRLKQLISDKTVQLRLDREKKDRYGRTLAQVYLRDGSWVNNKLVLEGLAQVYTFMPNYRWTERLLQSEIQARSENRGLWKSSRFRILEAKEISNRHIGQFRLIRGITGKPQPWRFKLGKLIVSVPRSYRQWFTQADLPQQGENITIRGTIRISSTGSLFLALHSPLDMR